MNKRNDVFPDLKKAFSPMPEETYAALMDAARSVKEEKPVKKTSFRAVLIAAAIIVTTMAVALAANELGLINFMDQIAGKLPKAATTQMAKTEGKTLSVGPLQISLRELLADGRVVVMTAQSQPADASQAVLVAGSGDFTDRLPDSEAKRLGIPGESSFLDAAKKNKLPLYIVSSYLTIDYDLHQGEEIMDSFYGEDGAMLQFDILQTNPEKVKDALDATLTFQVHEIDLQTKEAIAGRDWKAEEKISIPVSSVIAEKTYTPDGEAFLDGYTLKAVKAQQTVAGVYLAIEAEAGPDAKEADTRNHLYTWLVQDAEDKPFPSGINMSGGLREEVAWPRVTLEMMISIDALPETLKLTNEASTAVIILK